MQGLRKTHNSISEISIDPQPVGLMAVYLVETRSEKEAEEIAALFSELSESIQVRQLTEGKLVSYAVQALKTDSSMLDEVEELLKRNYAFVVTQRSFDELIYRIVIELARDTNSKLLDLPHCNICGKVEPFPTTIISLSDADGSVLISRCYCGKCTAEATAPSNKEFIRCLLTADEKDFGKLKEAELVRRSSNKRQMRFKIKH